LQQLFGSSHPAYAHALSVLASSYYSIGRPLDSLDLLKECLDICDKAFSSNHANLIPNLMLYGKLLRVTGDIVNATSSYKRALFIHMINFKSNQMEMQLKELNKCIIELESGVVTRPENISEMPMPSAEPDQVNVIVCANFGHRPSDEYALCIASSLHRMGSMNLVTLIAVGQPQHESGQLARHSLDNLMLSGVPVAFSKVVSSTDKYEGTMKISPYVSSDGVEMIARALSQAPYSKSLTILCDSCE
jgi:hypothetical protein